MQIEKKKTYAASLDDKLARECMPINVDQAWNKFKQAMSEAVEETMGKTHRQETKVKGLPHNSWFDEECKIAKRHLRSTPKTAIEWTALAKTYTTLKRRKRREHELHTETQALINFKKNPKKEWMRMKGKRQDITGDISPEDMYAYVEKLYVHKDAEGMPNMQETKQSEECFDFPMVTKSIKKLANGKAPDMLQFNSEMLKWSGNIARQYGYMDSSIKP